MKNKIKELIKKEKLQRKTIDELLQLSIDIKEEEKLLAVRRFISSFIIDLQRILI